MSQTYEVAASTLEVAASGENLFVSSSAVVLELVGCLGPDTFLKLLCKGSIIFLFTVLYNSFLEVKVKTSSLCLDLHGCVLCPRFCMSVGLSGYFKC